MGKNKLLLLLLYHVTKTISLCCRDEGGGAYWRGGESEYFKFRPIGGAIVRRGRLFEVKGTLIRRFKVIAACVLRRQVFFYP